MKTYFAVLHKDPESAVGVFFPDLPGCYSAGDDFNEAIRNAHEAIQLYAEVELESGRSIPEPRTLDELFADPEVRDDATGGVMVGIGYVEVADGRTRRAVVAQLGFGESAQETFSVEHKSDPGKGR